MIVLFYSIKSEVISVFGREKGVMFVPSVGWSCTP